MSARRSPRVRSTPGQMTQSSRHPTSDPASSSRTGSRSSSGSRTPTSRPQITPRRAATSSANSRRSKRRRDDEDDDEAEDDVESTHLFASQDVGPCLSRKFARTLWNDVKATSKLKYDTLDEELRAKYVGELVRYILLKGTRSEPIVKGNIKRDCGWNEQSVYENACTDALLAEAQRWLHGVGLDIARLHETDASAEVFGPNKYKNTFFVVQKLMCDADLRAKLELAASSEPPPVAGCGGEGDDEEDEDETESIDGSAATQAHAPGSTDASDDCHAAARAERGSLVAVLALMYSKAPTGSLDKPSAWKFTVSESELLGALHKLDARVDPCKGLGGGGLAAEPLHELGVSGAQMLARFAKQLYLVQGKDETVPDATGKPSITYRFGPRFFVEIGELRVYRFCAKLLPSGTEDSALVAKIKEREQQWVEESEDGGDSEDEGQAVAIE